MKATIIIFFLIAPLTCFSQEQVKEKETVYLLFNKESEEKCKVSVEGKGYVNMNKFRKEYWDNGNIIVFKICNETFTTHKTKSFKDTCSLKALDNIKFVDLEYINKKKSKTILRYNPFDKIYIIEKISDNKVIKYEVTWIDDWIMIDD